EDDECCDEGPWYRTDGAAQCASAGHGVSRPCSPVCGCGWPRASQSGRILLKFEIKRTDPTPECPNGLRYSFIPHTGWTAGDWSWSTIHIRSRRSLDGTRGGRSR